MSKGKPTIYKPEYCQQVIDSMSTGMSVAEFCKSINIGRSTFYEWVEAHEELRKAYDIAKDYCLAWWEQQGRLNLDNKAFSFNGWSIQVKNRFRADYFDRVENHTTHKIITHEDAIKELE